MKLKTWLRPEKVPGLDFTGTTSKTKQAFKEEADINNIMARYIKTGILVDPTMVNQARKGQFGDFTNGQDFRAMQNQIAEMRQVFSLLPSDIRRQFSNDPARMLDFMANPENADECVKLGLLPKPVKAATPESPMPSPNLSDPKPSPAAPSEPPTPPDTE